jgi:hypothetical protein
MDLKYRKIVTEHLMCEVKTDISYFDICEMQCYNESTADGYDVYVLKYTKDEVSITENVYYYDHDIAEQIMHSIVEDKIDSIYIDDYLYGEIYLEDVFEEYFNENVDEIVDDNPELFTKKELKYINEEYDLEIEV